MSKVLIVILVFMIVGGLITYLSIRKKLTNNADRARLATEKMRSSIQKTHDKTRETETKK